MVDDVERIQKLRGLKSFASSFVRKMAIGAAMVNSVSSNAGTTTGSTSAESNPTPIEIKTISLPSSNNIVENDLEDDLESEQKIISDFVNIYNTSADKNSKTQIVIDVLHACVKGSTINSDNTVDNNAANTYISLLEMNPELSVSILEDKTIMDGIGTQSKEKLIKNAFNFHDVLSEQSQQRLLDYFFDTDITANLDQEQKQTFENMTKQAIQNEVTNNEISGKFAAFAYENTQSLGYLINDENTASTQAKLLQSMYDDKDFWNELNTEQQSSLLQDAFNSPNVMNHLSSKMHQEIVNYKLNEILDTSLYNANDCQIALSELHQVTNYAFNYGLEEEQKRITDFGLNQLKSIERKKFDNSNEQDINQRQIPTASNITLAIDSARGDNYLLDTFARTIEETNNKNIYAANFIINYKNVIDNSSNGMYCYRNNNSRSLISLSPSSFTNEKRDNIYYFGCDPKEIELQDKQYIAVKRYVDSDNFNSCTKEEKENILAAIQRYETKNPSASTLYDYSKIVYFENLQGKEKEEINKFRGNIKTKGINGENHKPNYPEINKKSTLENILKNREELTRNYAKILKEKYEIDVPSFGFNVKNGKLTDRDLSGYQILFVNEYIGEDNKSFSNILDACRDVLNNGYKNFNCRFIDDKGILIGNMYRVNDELNINVNIDTALDNRGRLMFKTDFDDINITQRGKLNTFTPDYIPNAITSYINTIIYENSQDANNALGLVKTANDNKPELISSIQPTWANNGRFSENNPLYSYIPQSKTQVELQQNPQKGETFTDFAFIMNQMKNNGGRG